MLIVGYEETMHNAYYTADTNTFKESEYADMAEALNLTLAMPHLIDEMCIRDSLQTGLLKESTGRTDTLKTVMTSSGQQWMM